MKKNYLRFKKTKAVLAMAFMLSCANTFGQAVTTLTFAYTGSITTWTVPALCTPQVTIEVRGAAGGMGSSGTPGKGARMKGTFAVTTGQVLSILVGQCPGNASPLYTFPGGGGGSFVGLGAYATATPMIVAGGGGGCYNGATGDSAPITTSGTGNAPGTNGNGAPSSSCGGSGGGFFTSGGNDLIYNFGGGKGFQQGGAGGLANPIYSGYQPGGFGGGAPADYVGSCNLTAGNGGGYSGGSGYGTGSNGAGTAGGSYNGGANQLNTAGFQTGNGVVYLSFSTGIDVGISASSTLICQNTSAVLTASTSGSATYVWSNGQTTPMASFSPLINSTISVIGTDPISGCTGSASIGISVLEAPLTSILATKYAVCQGEGVTLFATAGISYTWSSGPTYGSVLSVTPTVANNSYTVISSGANGCTSSVSQQITVNTPPAVAVTGNSLICSGAAANLSATGATSYEWKSNSLYLQANPVSVSPNVTTTYSVTGTSAAGCKGTSLFVVAVDPCTGIKNISGTNSNVSVYPNPNAGVFTVALSNGLSKTIDVIDVTGRVIVSNTTSNDLTDVNISSLANGVYYVKVRSENVSEVIKVVKQ